LRYRLAYVAGMVTAVLDVFIKAVLGHIRRRPSDNGIDPAQCGAVMVQIVVNTTAAAKATTYLGPPESFHRKMAIAPPVPHC